MAKLNILEKVEKMHSCIRCKIFPNINLKKKCEICKRKNKHIKTMDFFLQSLKKQKIQKIQKKRKIIIDSILKIKNSEKRCCKCQKKIGIYLFKCQCKLDFCKNHKFPENHECSFDYKKTQKMDLLIKLKKTENKKIESF